MNNKIKVLSKLFSAIKKKEQRQKLKKLIEIFREYYKINDNLTVSFEEAISIMIELQTKNKLDIDQDNKQKLDKFNRFKSEDNLITKLTLEHFKELLKLEKEGKTKTQITLIFNSKSIVDKKIDLYTISSALFFSNYFINFLQKKGAKNVN